MTIDLDQFRSLKRRVDEAKSEHGRAEGALSQLMKKLKEDFGCETVEAAKELLSRKIAERDEAEREYAARLTAFQEKWGDRL